MITTKHSNVNSLRLVKEIDSFIIDELIDVESEWNDLTSRGLSMELFKLVMDDYRNTKKIDNFKCFSDGRNNTDDTMLQEIFNLTIEFVQAHCLNTTRLNYTFGIGVTK